MSDDMQIKITVDSRKAAKDIDKLVKRLDAVEKEAKQAGTAGKKAMHGVGEEAKDTEKEVKGLSSAFGKMKGLLIGLSFAAFGQQLISVNAEFSKMKAALVTVTGSASAADAAFKQISKFAAETPFAIQEVTRSFLKLKALGLDPSEEAMRSYGNTAAAMGKSMNDMVEAVADAATGEFERLKEFGIKAKSEGDRVTFTFQGVATEIGKNAAEIENYLMGIGNVQFAGGMERQAATLGGAISNLGDAWDSMLDKLMGGVLERFVSAVITGISDLLRLIGALGDGIDYVLRLLGFEADQASSKMTALATETGGADTAMQGAAAAGHSAAAGIKAAGDAAGDTAQSLLGLAFVEATKDMQELTASLEAQDASIVNYVQSMGAAGDAAKDMQVGLVALTTTRQEATNSLVAATTKQEAYKKALEALSAGMTKNTKSIKVNTKERRAALKVIKDHDKAVLGVMESLASEYIALTQGARAAYQYSLALQGLTEQEQQAALAVWDSIAAIRAKAAEAEKSAQAVADALASETAALQQQADEWNGIWRNLSAGFEDVFVDALSGSMRSFEEFTDSIKSMFHNLLRDLIRYALRNPVQIYTALTGGGGGGLGGLMDMFTGGGGSGMGSILQGIIGSWSGAGAGSVLEGQAFMSVPFDQISQTGIAGGGLKGLAGMGGPAGMAVSGLAGGVLGYGIGSVIGGEKYGGVAGAVGGGAGAMGASALGMGALSATGWGAIAAIAVSLISKLTEDENFNSKLTLFNGPGGGMFGASTMNNEGDFLKDKTGKRTGIWEDMLFGGAGAKGQHIGEDRDDQITDEAFQQWLDGMREAFQTLDALDIAAAEVFDLSDASINKIKEEVESLSKSTEKMGSPSFGDFVIARYNVVFDEIGGLADKMWDNFNRQGLDDDTALQAVDAVIMLNAQLQGLRNVAETTATVIADAALTQYDMHYLQAEGVYELIEAYDGTLSSTQELTAGLDAQRLSTIGLLVAIEQIRNGIDSMLGSTREKILTDPMTDEEKFNYYKGQADSLSSALATMTDPAKIAETTAEINRLIGLTWGLQMAAGEDEAGIKQQEYLDYLDSINALAQSRLNIAEQEAIAEAEKLATAVETAILASLTPLTEAAETIEESTTDMADAAADIEAAVIRFGRDVTIFGGFVDSIDSTGGFTL